MTTSNNEFERAVTKEIKLPRVPDEDQPQLILVTPHEDKANNQFLLVCQKVTNLEGTDKMIPCGAPMTFTVTNWEMVAPWFSDKEPPASYR